MSVPPLPADDFTPPPADAAPAAPGPLGLPADRPELLVGAALAGGVLFALLLKRAGRVS